MASGIALLAVVIGAAIGFKTKQQPGPRGPPGPPGQTGQTGQTGQPGQPGQTGQAGQPGKTGKTGQAGQPGKTGQSGQPGQTPQSKSSSGEYKYHGERTSRRMRRYLGKELEKRAPAAANTIRSALLSSRRLAAPFWRTFVGASTGVFRCTRSGTREGAKGLLKCSRLTYDQYRRSRAERQAQGRALANVVREYLQRHGNNAENIDNLIIDLTGEDVPRQDIDQAIAEAQLALPPIPEDPPLPALPPPIPEDPPPPALPPPIPEGKESDDRSRRMACPKDYKYCSKWNRRVACIKKEHQCGPAKLDYNTRHPTEPLKKCKKGGEGQRCPPN